jgi:hypothetical protein
MHQNVLLPRGNFSVRVANESKHCQKYVFFLQLALYHHSVTYFFQHAFLSFVTWSLIVIKLYPFVFISNLITDILMKYLIYRNHACSPATTNRKPSTSSTMWIWPLRTTVARVKTGMLVLDQMVGVSYVSKLARTYYTYLM